MNFSMNNLLQQGYVSTKYDFPPQIQKLFAARDPIPFIPKQQGLEKEAYEEVSKFVPSFSKFEPKRDEKKDSTDPEDEEITIVLPRWKVKEKKKLAKIERYKKKLKKELEKYNPKEDPSLQTNPYSTLFICRLNYATTDATLRREFQNYGPIKLCKVIRDEKGKSRGYAFLEFENETDMKRAYRYSEHKVIDGKKVLVDVERARICYPKWKPRRLGGGIGESRKEKMKKKEIERLERIKRKQQGSSRSFGGRGGGRRFGGGGGRRFGGGGGRDGGGGRRFGGGRRREGVGYGGKRRFGSGDDYERKRRKF